MHALRRGEGLDFGKREKKVLGIERKGRSISRKIESGKGRVNRRRKGGGGGKGQKDSSREVEPRPYLKGTGKDFQWAWREKYIGGVELSDGHRGNLYFTTKYPRLIFEWSGGNLCE